MRLNILLPVAALALGCAASAASQETIDESRRNAIVRAVEVASPAVVSVNVLEIQYERVVDPFFRDFFRLFEPRVRRYREREVQGIGSGFFFREDGYLLTNVHVVERADKLSVTLPDGRTLDAEAVGLDHRSDVAVLKVNEPNLPYLPLGDSSDLLIGEWVIALGNPFGMLVEDPNPSVSVGVVSANHRRVSSSVGRGERLFQDMIQTDAAINPGNSGGPLVNSRGQVVGMNTFIFSQSGGNVGLGFAIPINRARRVAGEIITYGRRRDPWPGFTVVRTERGVVVYEMLNTAPAYRNGMRPGDIIKEINGNAIAREADVDFAFWDMFVGEEARVSLERRGDTRTIVFPIEELRN